MLATCCLPWSDSYAIVIHAFRSQTSRLMAAGVENLYLFGTAGEGYAVTSGQFEMISQPFMSETTQLAGIPQLGIIGLSLPLVQERIAIGMSLGCQSFQISFPSWGRLADREVDAFFAGTYGRYARCSFLFYNVARGLRCLMAEEVAAVGRQFPNFMGVKWTTSLDEPDLANIVECAPELAHFFSDIDYIRASLLGLRCCHLMSLSTINLRLGRQLFDLGQRRDDDLLLQRRLAELNRHCTIISELDMKGSYMDGVVDKLFCRLHDADFPLRMIPPYQGASEMVFQEYRRRLTAELPDWIDTASGWS